MLIICDKPDSKKDLADKFNKFIKSAGNQLWIVSPYVSKINEFNYANLKRIKDLRCICNWKDTSCDPSLVKSLWIKYGMDIKRRVDTHAKVFISSKSALVGSANLTEGSVGNGNIEAVIFIDDDDSIKLLREWFISLWDHPSSFPIKKVKKSEWDELIARHKAAQRRRGGNKISSPEKPHFTDLLIEDKLINVVFAFVSKDADISQESVDRALDNARQPKAEGWWQDGPCLNSRSNDVKVAMTKANSLNKRYSKYYIIEVTVTQDKNKKHIKKFHKIDLFDLDKGILKCKYRGKVAIVETLRRTPPNKPYFSVSDSIKNKMFINWLKNGLKRNLNMWKKYEATSEGIHGFCDVKTLMKKLLMNVNLR